MEVVERWVGSMGVVEGWVGSMEEVEGHSFHIFCHYILFFFTPLLRTVHIRGQ